MGPRFVGRNISCMMRFLTSFRCFLRTAHGHGEDFGDFITNMLKPDVASIMVNAVIAKKNLSKV